jgi:hypothetical protein
MSPNAATAACTTAFTSIAPAAATTVLLPV